MASASGVAVLPSSCDSRALGKKMLPWAWAARGEAALGEKMFPWAVRGEAARTLAAVSVTSLQIPDYSRGKLCLQTWGEHKQTRDSTRGRAVASVRGGWGTSVLGLGVPTGGAEGADEGTRGHASRRVLTQCQSRTRDSRGCRTWGGCGGGGDPGRSLRRGRPCRPQGTGRSTGGRRGLSQVWLGRNGHETQPGALGMALRWGWFLLLTG